MQFAQFAEALVRIREQGEQHGFALLASTLSMHDIGLAKTILRRIRSFDADSIEHALSRSCRKDVLLRWISERGCENAAKIVLIVERQT